MKGLADDKGQENENKRKRRRKTHEENNNETRIKRQTIINHINKESDQQTLETKRMKRNRKKYDKDEVNR